MGLNTLIRRATRRWAVSRLPGALARSSIRRRIHGRRDMFKLHSLSLFLAAAALAGCQAVNTTSSGAVGVDRKQYMFSMLSTEQVNQMFAQSYQQTVSEAKSKGVLENNSPVAQRVNRIAS